MPNKNPQRTKEYNRQYNQEHTEERNAKTACVCGGIFALKHRARHYRTDIHQAYEAHAKLELTEN